MGVFYLGTVIEHELSHRIHIFLKLRSRPVVFSSWPGFSLSLSMYVSVFALLYLNLLFTYPLINIL